MPKAKLVITLPDGIWIQEVTVAHPDAEFEVLASLPGEGRGVALVNVAAPELARVIADIQRRACITDLDILQTDGTEALVEFETTEPLLLASAKESGIPIEPPVYLQDGKATLELTASRERLSMLGTQLGAFGMEFSVEYIHEVIDSEPLLTDRQHALVTMALERGYYDTPRTCSLTELAAEVGIAKSTASETLHRAEGTIIKQFSKNSSPEAAIEQ